MPSGGSDGGGDSTVRYAPYIEAKHETFLNNSETFGTSVRALIPYASYTDLDYDDAFFGSGFTMASFPSLYDMFGKFMAGLDLESLWDQVLNDVQNSSTIQTAVIAHRDILDDDLQTTVMPRFKEGMRDMNAIMSSSFVVGKSIIEKGVVKKLAEFDANLRYKLIPVAAEVFSKHLSWNQGMIKTYLEVMRLAITAKLDTDARNLDIGVKDAMWPFTVLEQERANIGALQGAVSSKAGETSTARSVIGGVVGGAAAGASIGGSTGAIVGGVIGGIAGLF